jgi:hypothetical protein
MRLVLIALCLAIAGPIRAADMTLEQVIERHTQAMGGKQAIESVKAVQFALTIVEPTFSVDGIYRADRDLRMRIDVYADGKRVYTEAYDGSKAWQMGDDGKPHEPNAQGTAALRNGILLPGKLFGLHESRRTGNKLRLLERETVDNTSFHVVELTTVGGDVHRLYINPDSWLIERTRVRKALHPDNDPTEKWFESRLTDFRRTDGVLRSFKSVEVDLESGAVVQTTTVKEVVTNPALENEVFQRPG